KVDAFVELMAPLGLVEVARTGVAAIRRGPEGF
ncbi:MAG: acetolactate synthase small subunit, partial [Pseudomonadota bacterium]